MTVEAVVTVLLIPLLAFPLGYAYRHPDLANRIFVPVAIAVCALALIGGPFVVGFDAASIRASFIAGGSVDGDGNPIGTMILASPTWRTWLGNLILGGLGYALLWMLYDWLFIKPLKGKPRDRHPHQKDKE